MTFFIDCVRSPLQKRYPFLGDHDAYVVYALYRYPDRVANCSSQWKERFIHEAGYRHQSNFYYDLYYKYIYQNVDINTGSNLLRGVQTTEVHDLYLDKKITLREKDAVDRVGMHGAAVVKQHYLMCNQEAAAKSSLEVGKALRSESIGPPKEDSRPRMLTDDFVARGRATSTYSVPTNFLLLPWGSLHSSAGDMTMKASWGI